MRPASVPRQRVILAVLLICARPAAPAALSPEFDDAETMARRVLKAGSRLNTALEGSSTQDPPELPNAAELNVLHKELVDVSKELGDVATGLRNQSIPCVKRREEVEEAEGFKEGFKTGWKFGWSQGVLQTQFDKSAGPQALREIGLKVPDGAVFDTVDGSRLEAAPRRTAEVFTAPHTNSPGVEAIRNAGRIDSSAALNTQLSARVDAQVGAASASTGVQITTPYTSMLLAEAADPAAPFAAAAAVARPDTDAAAAAFAAHPSVASSLVDRQFSFAAGGAVALPPGVAGPPAHNAPLQQQQQPQPPQSQLGFPAQAAMTHHLQRLLQQPTAVGGGGSTLQQQQQPQLQQPLTPAMQMQTLALSAAASGAHAPGAGFGGGAAAFQGDQAPLRVAPSAMDGVDAHRDMERALHTGLGRLADLR